MKINENKPPAVDTKRPAAREAGAARASESGAPPAPPASAGPAVSVTLGGGANVAAAVAASGTVADTELSDVELLEHLRERMQKGEFEIDYESLAKSVLDDAMAAMTRRRNE